jgi:hypothetical protein
VVIDAASFELLGREAHLRRDVGHVATPEQH